MALVIHPAEEQAGLGPALAAAGRVSWASTVQRRDPATLPPRVIAAANQGQPDLHYLETVLVTAGLRPEPDGRLAGENLNDDFFGVDEVWPARHTPRDKPFNFEHDCAQIIGHITDNRVLAGEGGELHDGLALEQLPDKLFIVTGAVLYKSWDKEELQKRMDRLLAEIDLGQWSVSMEALFSDFDYLLIPPTGAPQVVARTAKTAHLSKALRVLGGSGVHEGKRVARYLRRLVFSGKGLVRSPANPESVILNSHASQNNEICEAPGYGSVTDHSNGEMNTPMAIDADALQKQLDGLKAENETLKANLHKNDIEGVAKARDAALAEVTSLKASQATLNARVSELEGALATSASKLVETQAALDAARAEVAERDRQAVLAARLATAKETLKLTDEHAKAFVANTASLADDAFSAQVDVLAKAMNSWVSSNPQPGNTTAPHGAVKTAPTATSLPTAPKATSKPSKAAEMDDEDLADESVLEDAETDTDADLAVATVEDDDDLRKAVAAFFGCEDTETN